MRKKIMLLLSVSLLAACGQKETVNETSSWKEAMSDAVFAEDDEIHPLVCLTTEDDRVIWNEAGDKVLLVTYHNYPDECPVGEAIGDYGDIWATSLGEVMDWYEENGKNVEDWNLRFSELLGLHEDEGCNRFTAFWVSVEDVIRPAFVQDVTKQMENDYSLVTGEFKEWFDGNILFSYFESDYPWTRLGYTYDWGGDDEYGLTEFLIQDPAKTEIVFTYSTDEFVDYLNQTGE